jgi:hypothetical protein
MEALLMKLKIVVNGLTTTVDVRDEEAYVMVERDYQLRLEEAENKTMVEKREPQEILNELYQKERRNEWREEKHRVRPSLPKDSSGAVTNYADAFLATKQNAHAGYNYGRLQRYSCRSAESEAVEAVSEDRVMRILRENLTPEQMDLVMEVILKDRAPSVYAKEHNVTKSAITHRLETVRKKLQKIFSDTSTFAL